MSDERKSSLLASLWHAAFIVLGSVFAVWIAVKLLEQIWWVLAIIGALVITLLVSVQWWRSRRRW